VVTSDLFLAQGECQTERFASYLAFERQALRLNWNGRANACRHKLPENEELPLTAFISFGMLSFFVTVRVQSLPSGEVERWFKPLELSKLSR
jgi:hypothetical protein